VRIVKYIVGALFALYALAQVLALIFLVAFAHPNYGDAYADGKLFGSFAGICIGTGIAVLCFRPKKQ